MKNYSILLSCLLLTTIYSCKKDEVIQTASPFYSYIPTDTGRWILYDVDSTFYDNFPTPVSAVYHYTFQVIERIDSTYIDNQGRPTQRLERCKRDSANAPWQNKIIWASTLTSSRYEKVEDGRCFVKLGFPIKEFTEWDGNAYNTLGKEDYSYISIHTAAFAPPFYFDSAITVIRGDTPNVVYEKNGTETFANHVGMIYKKFVDIKFDTIPNHPGGVKYVYTINSYGLHNAPMPLEN